MLTHRRFVAAVVLAALFALAGTLPAEDKDKEKLKGPAETPTELPRIPQPDAKACELPAGFAAHVVTTGLTYPTSIEFDDKGIMYIAEAGEAPGDEAAQARVIRLVPSGPNATITEVVADQLNSPVNDILWHQGKLYISHRGKISVAEGGKVRDLVTGLPSLGDHHNNQMTVGPDGKIYFGQGTATNSGVVGIDNYFLGWLHKHPSFHDVPAKDVALAADASGFESPDLIAIFTKSDLKKTKTGAFRAFGKTAGDGDTVKGEVKANGTILRMDADGKNLEVYAWGLRNPYGVKWGPDGKLYAGDAGYDERGSRPVANSPDCLWEIKKDAWYGWPDYSAGIPVTDERYKPKDGPAPKFLMKDHPKVEKPLMTFAPHTSATKFDFSPGGAWGKGTAFAALLGDLAPLTGAVPADFLAYAVAKVDAGSKKVEPFFRAKKDALGPKGFEHVATAGPRRPVAVKFSPKGDALFVVDFGAIAMVPSGIGGLPKPFPGTGVVWVILPTPPR
jgi:glucose/arabinose dehydrogenase